MSAVTTARDHAARRIKVCGLRTPGDARACVEAGVDLIGLVFVPGSRRRLDLAEAKSVLNAIAGRAEVVGVFMNQHRSEVEYIASVLALDRVQLHGSEALASWRDLGWPLIKRLEPGKPRTPDWPAEVWPLLDPGAGTGEPFGWDRLSGFDAGDAMIAGGLEPDTVEDAIVGTNAWAVDVSSGVESAGQKDPARIEAFCRRARSAFARRPIGRTA